jgi:hypothetical protein
LLKRRKLLQLGAGAAVLGPLGAHLLRDAEAAVPTPKRFLVLTAGAGFHRVNYRREPTSETEFPLGGVYSSFEAKWKSKLTILERFYNPFDLALHGNAWALLCMKPSTRPDDNPDFRLPNPGGISIDRFIGQELVKRQRQAQLAEDAQASIAMGLQEYGNAPALCVSADGPDQPFPARATPMAAYSAYFGALAEGQTLSPEQLLARDQSLLDFVRGETASLGAQLGMHERRKLDQYETSLRELEHQLGRVYASQGQCAAYTGPNPGLDHYVRDVSMEACHAFADIAANAFACNLTHAAHISILGREAPHRAFPWLTGNLDHHGMGANHTNDMASMAKIDEFVLSLLPRIMDKLAEVPEGNGSMADNTLLMYVNSCGGRDHNGQYHHAVVMLGDAGGAIRAGRYLRYPGGPAYQGLAHDPDATPGVAFKQTDPNQHSLSDVYVAVARAMDIPIDSFGDPAHCKGPLPGLLRGG